jgi:hypothetical protein
VEAGHILLFARAIGDPNPAYRDPERAYAPPTFVQAGAQFDEDYGLRPKPGQPWMGSASAPTQRAGGRDESGSGGSREGGTGLHAEQHYVYHRPLRAGDVLTATSRPGETWEKQGRRGGAMKFSESIVEYRDQNGELVVTATSVGVRTSQVVEQS